jgi:hypothetical protein
MYFWEFLLGGRASNSPFSDLGKVPQGLNNMPQMELNMTPDLFYTYANLVAVNSLPWQPSADDLADDKNISLTILPTDVDLDLEENSIYIAKVTLPTPEEGKGVTITASNLAESGTIAAIGSGSGLIPISDSDALDLCGGESEFTVVAGRGANVSALSGPSLTVTKKDPCEQIPPCIVGTWQQDAPATEGYISTDGSLQHTYRADGTFTQQYDSYVVTFNLPNQASYDVTYITSTFNGTWTVKRDPSTPGHYTVTSWGRQMDPGGVVTMDRFGRTIDITSQITEKYFSDGVPTDFQCDIDNAQNTHFTGHIHGSLTDQLGATDWSFTRVP